LFGSDQRSLILPVVHAGNAEFQDSEVEYGQGDGNVR
jgi:hypothetical protein